MEAWNSFLQTVFRFVKSLFVNVSKKMHRNAVVLTSGVAVVTVMTFTAGDFHGGGKSALVAFAETPQLAESAEAELEESQAATEPEAEPIYQQSDSQESAEPETTEPETEETKAVEMEKTQAESIEAKYTQSGSKELEAASEENPKPKHAESEGPGAVNMEAESSGTESADAGLKEIMDNENTEPESEAAEVFACSASDYRVLLKIVQAEAGICDTKGRILVANVILNRVKSGEFPNTIPGVVYEKSQFSPVIDGSIDTCKVTQKTIDAVDRALAGEDYSEGALYFMNRRTSAKKNVRWFDNNLNYLFKHGDHEFFK